MSIDGLNVTSLVQVWHAALTGLFPHYLELGYGVDSDAWELCCGHLLNALVLSPASDPSESFQISISPGAYALWDPASPRHGLWVVPTEAPLVLVENAEGHWAVDSALSEGWVTPVRFVEFSHPFASSTEPSAISAACGRAPGPKGVVKVVIAHESAEYFLRSE